MQLKMEDREIRLALNRNDVAFQLRELSDMVGWNHPLELCREIANVPEFSYYTIWYKGVMMGGAGLVTYGNQGYLSMVMVKPKFQHQGACTELLKGVLRHRRDLEGFRLNATDAGVGVYERLGFRKEIGTLCLAAPKNVTVTLPAGDVVPMTAEDAEWASALDREIYGQDRSGLIRYNIGIHPEQAFRLENRSGFVLGRRDGEFAQFAILEASDASSALSLLGGVVAREPERPRFLFCHDVQREFIAGLERAGFLRGNAMVDMTLGKTEPPDVRRYFLTYGGDFG